MAGEIETASDMFARQERERDLFLVEQAERLDDAGFGWELPERFCERLSYQGKCLVIRDNSERDVVIERASTVFSKEGKLFTLGPHGVVIPHETHNYVEFYGLVEQRVNETVAGLQAVKVPA